MKFAHFLGMAGFLFLLSSAWSLPAPSMLLEVNGTPGEFIGRSVMPLADVDLDGFVDLASGSIASNKVVLFSGKNGQVIWERFGQNNGDWFGHALGKIPDISGDSVPELIVGAPQWNDGLPSGPGYVRVLSGANGSVLFSASGENSGDIFGWSVAGMGDLTGDGFPEILVGSPYHDVLAFNEGSVHIFSPKTNALVKKINGLTPSQLGYSLTAFSDFDGDAVPDFAAGAPYGLYNQNPEGKVLVFSGKTFLPLHTFYGEAAQDWFGWAIAQIEDATGDHVEDLVVGAPFFNSSNNGRVYVYDGVSKTLVWKADGPFASWFGKAVADAGDADNDGFSDVLAGAPLANQFKGMARVLSGKNGAVLASLEGPQSNSEFGEAVSGNIDVEGNGVDDFFIATANKNGLLQAWTFFNGTLKPYGLACGVNDTPALHIQGIPSPGETVNVQITSANYASSTLLIGTSQAGQPSGNTCTNFVGTPLTVISLPTNTWIPVSIPSLVSSVPLYVQAFLGSGSKLEATQPYEIVLK
ncbi:MAG: FG-GAP repeat protein [Candidatus Diapherotrites archaeon]|nr:FG-GAP repeat protein [Candidatus Diapherotrites archaeon]